MRTTLPSHAIEHVEKPWYTMREVEARLHVRPRTAWRLVRPYRSRCHLARGGQHPRLLLWVPRSVLRELEEGRIATWRMGSRGEIRAGDEA
jgi:hypothetical protein